jgi:benzoyl-CoA reductase/2-hydroxyglutaryl-CoA dehydratase subunit BcrC/BadD/HgdB
VLITFRNSCDVYVKWWESMHRHLGKPLFIGETPYVLSEEDLGNYVLDYVVKQLERLIEFLGERFGVRLDMDRLERAVRLSDEASRLWLEALSLRRHRPCPLGGRDAASDIFPLVIMQGTEEAVRFYEELLGEVRDRVRRGIGVVDDEKIRLMFDGIWIWHSLDIIKYLEDRGAVFVYEPYSWAWAYRMDPSKPLESIARKMLDMGLNISVEMRVRRFLGEARRMGVDGAILFSNRSCKTWSATQAITAEVLREEMGIPCLVIEADHTDPRQYSIAQIRNRIDAFIEMLGGG